MIIENSKTYNVNEVENLFFRPSFCGKSAEELGIRVLYTLPVPTKIPVFYHHNSILKEFSSGWQGEHVGELQETEIPMTKLKAEKAYSAESYFASIYELLTNSAEVNLGDLTGTDLEKAETELFRRAICNNIYATMWFGDEEGSVSNFSGFSGFLRKIIDIKEDETSTAPINIADELIELSIEELLHEVWVQATPNLRSRATDGQLAFFVSSDIYDAYQFYLDEKGLANITGEANCRPTLYYHGIPMVELPASQYGLHRAQSFCILTDRRNLVLALNTADSPEKEIRMWYNPDEMENRQRVVFLAGTAVVDPELVSAYIFDNGVVL